MKTDWICVSNRLFRMAIAYLCAACAAIALPGATAARADGALLCVLVPHFKDEYWLSVAYGIEQRAAEQALAVRFFEAGGYQALDAQIRQLADCAALDPGAVLIGAVSSNAPELLDAIHRAAQQGPVIGLVNELHSPDLAARVGVDWQQMGEVLGRHLSSRFPATDAPQTAVFLTGPPESGWVGPLEAGLRQGLAGSGVTIAAVYGADTGVAQQLRLVEAALREHPEAGLLIGPAPAIEAAMGYLHGQSEAPLLAATYMSYAVARGLVGGRIEAAPFDDPVRQGQMSVDAAVAAMAQEASPQPLGPPITLLRSGEPARNIRLSPVSYFPKRD